MMAQEKVTGHSSNHTFSITLNGNQELLEVNISPDIDLNQPDIEKNIKQAYADAQDKLKSLMAEKLKGMM